MELKLVSGIQNVHKNCQIVISTYICMAHGLNQICQTVGNQSDKHIHHQGKSLLRFAPLQIS